MSGPRILLNGESDPGLDAIFGALAGFELRQRRDDPEPMDLDGVKRMAAWIGKGLRSRKGPVEGEYGKFASTMLTYLYICANFLILDDELAEEDLEYEDRNVAKYLRSDERNRYTIIVDRQGLVRFREIEAIDGSMRVSLQG